MKLMKKLVAVVAALTLTVGMFSTVMAASWTTWINKTYESAVGKVSTNSSGFTAKLKSIGWMGCWGGQAHWNQKTEKGKQYTLKFNIKSSKMDKYVWVKIGNDSGSVLSVGKWIDCKKGQTISFNETFTAKGTFKMVSFGFGGDYGDRAGVSTDGDAKARYKYAPSKKLDGRLGPDSSADHPTVITVSGLSLTEASSGGSSSGGSSNSGNVSGNNGNVNSGAANGSASGGTAGSAGTANTVSTSDTTVSTGDFTPIACGATAVLAAVAIVVFTKRRQED